MTYERPNEWANNQTKKKRVGEQSNEKTSGRTIERKNEWAKYQTNNEWANNRTKNESANAEIKGLWTERATNFPPVHIESVGPGSST